jgi:tetratricopeptide (TPR) repeat protein
LLASIASFVQTFNMVKGISYSKTTLLLLMSSFFVVSLAGCSHNSQKVEAIAVSPDVTSSKPEKPTNIEYRKIDKDSLYDILLAEVAARRDRKDIAASSMLKAAQRTQDLALTERSAHMAHYFQDFDTLNSAANLWHTLAPTEGRATLLQAAALTQQGRYLDAFAILMDALKVHQNANFPPLASAATKEDAEQQQKLLDAFENALEIYPDELQLLIGKTILLDGLSRPQLALDSSDQVLLKEPNNYAALHIKTRSLQLLQRHIEAIQVLQKTLEIYPEASKLRLHLARILTDIDLTKASEQFGILTEQFPTEGRYRLSFALTLKQLYKQDEAIAQFNTLLEQQQLQSEASFYLAQLYKEDYPELASQFCQDVERDSAYFLAAQSLYLDTMEREGHLTEAIAQINLLQTTQDTISLKLALLLSQKLTATQRYIEAAEELENSITRLGNDIELRYQLALINSQLGHHLKAQQGFESILKDNSQHTGALNALGFLLAEQNKELDRAYDLVALALQHRPDDAAIIDSLGWILFKQGKHQEAANYLAKAHNLLKDPEISSHFIETLWLLNRRIEASDIAIDALKRFPKHPLLIETLQRFNIAPQLDLNL